MTEFWKSNPRHFCTYCKCWIADNRPSKDFHESGKRHQENVRKKIDEVMKNGVKRDREKAEMDKTMKQIEKAALAALKKDVQKDPAMASRYGICLKPKEIGPAVPPEGLPVPEKYEETEQYKATVAPVAPMAEATSSSKKQKKNEEDVNNVWKEEWTPEGFVYYWNINTRENSWEKPEGYVPSWERQLKAQQEGSAAAETGEGSLQEEVESSDTDKDSLTGSENELQEEEESNTCNEAPPEEDIPVAVAADSPLPPIRVEDIALPPSPPLPPPAVIIRPPRPTQVRTNPAYGSWETNSVEEEPLPDLQLPVTEMKEEVQSIVLHSEPKIKFREKKVVQPLGKEGFVAFKKRKINTAGLARCLRGSANKSDTGS